MFSKRGPVKLNLAQRKVRVNGKEARLTPKQSKLLELFMHNPGKLLTRKKLIREVWLTDYTGDTRTLDVHMSWLRHAIEPDPAKPEFLHTNSWDGISVRPSKLSARSATWT